VQPPDQIAGTLRQGPGPVLAPAAPLLCLPQCTLSQPETLPRLARFERGCHRL